MHELGHTWGRGEHCRSHCVLGFSNTVREIDALPDDYCEECNALAERAVTELRGVALQNPASHEAYR